MKSDFEIFKALVKNDELAVCLTDWTHEDRETLAEDCPSLLGTVATLLPSLPSERLFSSNGNFYMYVPESTGTYLLGCSLQNGWQNYKLGRSGAWKDVARRIDCETGEPMFDYAGLTAAYSVLELQNEELSFMKNAVDAAEKKLSSLDLVIKKEAALAGVTLLLQQIKLHKLQKINFLVTDEGFVSIQEYKYTV